MGIDFIRGRARSFQKSWDRRRVQLATPDLFTRQPQSYARSATADLIEGKLLSMGDVLVVQKIGDDMIAIKGISEVARFSNPPSDLVSALSEACNVARGTVCQINEISGTVEISLC